MTSDQTPQSPYCKKTIFISGMTCASCEGIIKEELQAMPEIDGVGVSKKTGRADIIYKQEGADVSDAIKTIERLGYKASQNAETKKIKNPIMWSQWFSAVMIVAALYLLYRTVAGWGMFDWFGADMTQASYGVAFLIGVVASMSTCLAMVGAVIISFAAKYRATGSYYQKNIRPHMLFQAGRLSSFLILGGLLGLIGSWFQMPVPFAAVLSILIAAVLIWLGLNVLGIVPSLSALGIHLPKMIMKPWMRLKESDHPLAPVVLGAMTFFIPCGFTQSMQVFAVASGNAITGALTMLFFALGTMPVLMSIGIATTRFSGAKSGVFKKAIGFIILIFAFYTFSSGLAQYGFNLDIFSDPENARAATVANHVQTIRMTVDYNGFSPNVFTITKGTSVRWIINGKQITGCTNEIIMPDLNIRKKLVSGENIIEFTPTKAGALNFSCWMGMVRGKFIVVDKTAGTDDPAIPDAQAQGASDSGLSGSCGAGAGCGAAGLCGGGCGMIQ